MIKTILSKLFGAAVKNRNEKFDKKSDDLVRLHTPVISVGNLCVGGSGKTPFVQMLTWILLKNGIRPAIVGRGYKRKSKGSVVVSDGKEIFVDATTGGDEMYLLAESLKVPVIAHDVKAEGARLAENKFNPDVIIIDDGYQHRQLYRDLDILLIGQDDISNPELMPKGRLREPLSAADRADVIVFTGKTEPNEELLAAIKPETTQIRITRTEGRPFNMTENRYFDRKNFGVLKKGVFAVSGIAKPKNFIASIKALRFPVKGYYDFDDHHHYSESDIHDMIKRAKDKNCTTIATTEKDASKLHVFNQIFIDAEILVVVFPVRLKVIDGFKQLKNILDILLKKDERK